MRTKQTDTAAMTEEQLDAVAGGYAVHDLAGKAGTAFRPVHLQEACANGTFLRSKKSFGFSYAEQRNYFDK